MYNGSKGGMGMAGTVIISFTVDRETDSELRKYAEENKLTISMAVRELVAKSLSMKQEATA